MCLSRHQGLTPRRDRADCLWPCPCLKSRASKLAPESKHEARTAQQISVAAQFLTPLRRVCANRVILLKLAERQQAQCGYLIMHPQPQTVGIRQTFHSIQASRAAKRCLEAAPFCQMMFVPCYSDSEAKRLLETLSFVQGKHLKGSYGPIIFV